MSSRTQWFGTRKSTCSASPGLLFFQTYSVPVSSRNFTSLENQSVSHPARHAEPDGILAKRNETLLEPGARGRLRTTTDGEQVGTGITPFPLSDKFSDPVVHARDRLVGIWEFRRHGIINVSVVVDDGGVAWVVTLKP